MKRFIFIMVAAFEIVLSGGIVTAKTHIEPIPCANGFEDAYTGVDVDRWGHVIRRYGVDCNGEHWIIEWRPKVQLVDDPGWDYTYLYTGESNGGTWWVKVQMGSDNHPAKIWGKDTEDNLWDYTGS